MATEKRGRISKNPPLAMPFLQHLSALFEEQRFSRLYGA
jgi:hypothetical protein